MSCETQLSQKRVSSASCSQVGDALAEETTLERQLPAILHYIADVLHSPISTVLVAGCNGLEGEAAVVAAAHGSHHTGQDVYHALVELQHCYHILQVRVVKPSLTVVGACLNCTGAVRV